MSYATSSGAQIAYRTRGTGDPVLLVAGTAQGGDTWPRSLVDALAQRYTVITYDNRSTGRSPTTPGEYSTRGFGADAAAVLEAVDLGPAHVVGHSMGGRIAQWLVLDRPDLVRTLTLAASGPGALTGPDGELQEIPRGVPVGLALQLVRRDFEEFFRERLHRTFFTPEQLTAEADLVEETIDVIIREAPDLEGYLKHVSARQNHQTAHLLDRITTPTLLVYGDKDDHAGFAGNHIEQSEYLAAHVAGARTVILPGQSHGFFWTVPERSAEVLTTWWDEVGA